MTDIDKGDEQVDRPETSTGTLRFSFAKSRRATAHTPAPIAKLFEKTILAEAVSALIVGPASSRPTRSLPQP